MLHLVFRHFRPCVQQYPHNKQATLQQQQHHSLNHLEDKLATRLCSPICTSRRLARHRHHPVCSQVRAFNLRGQHNGCTAVPYTSSEPARQFSRRAIRTVHYHCCNAFFRILFSYHSPGSTSRPLPEAQAVRLGQPAQPDAFPASSAAGPTHPSFAFAGTFFAEFTADCCCCGAEASDCGMFAVSAIFSMSHKRVAQGCSPFQVCWSSCT